MAQTERKQVLPVGAKITQLVTQVAVPTPPIGNTVHGDIKDLTVNGTGFNT